MFFNSTDHFGTVLYYMTTDITGSLFLTLLIILLVIVAVALALRIPVEFTAVLIVPVMLVLMAYTSEFLAIGGLLLIYLGILTAKNFFIGT
jgi:hypothetical protein